MIDKAAFKDAWRKLLVRFGKEVNADQAAMYYDYLSQLMETDEYLRASHAIWASAKWFPRPAEFLIVRAGSEWPLVLKCAEGFHPPDWPWTAPWKELTPRAQAACRRLGGMESIREQTKNTPRLREAFLSAYEEEATAEVLALPMTQVRNLPPQAA